MHTFNAYVMKNCISYAKRYAGYTKSNPLVGAAVVKNGEVLSYGAHEYYGGPHAEVNALANAGAEAEGAELYVTLEPCSTYGKTPPCTDAILKAGIKKVYVGVLDPNPEHMLKGVDILRKRGIEVEIGVALTECAALIEDFAKTIIFRQPYVTLKAGMSLDGKVATKTGDSKWITSPQSREEAHRLRSRADAVIVGVGTVLADDPMLNVRLIGEYKQPLRIVIDTNGRLPLTSQLVKTARDLPVIVYTGPDADKENIAALIEQGVHIKEMPLQSGKVDVCKVLDELYITEKVMNVLVEGGPQISGAFIDNDLVDALKIFVAPKIIGSSESFSVIGGDGVSKLNEIIPFISMDASKVGNDLFVEAVVRKYTTKIITETEAVMELSL